MSVDTPLDTDVHVIPLFVVLNIIPLAPATYPVDEFIKDNEYISSDVKAMAGDIVANTDCQFVNVIKVPLSPTRCATVELII